MASKVYFIRACRDEGDQVISRKTRTLFAEGGFADCFRENDLTAIKVHVGEDGNTTYITAPCIKGLAEELLELKTRPFVTDTTTLYAGRRHNAVDHAALAAEHGFSLEGLGIPWIPPDGLSGSSAEIVEIKRQGDFLIMEMRTTEPVKWKIRGGLSQEDFKSLLKASFKSSVLGFLLNPATWFKSANHPGDF